MKRLIALLLFTPALVGCAAQMADDLTKKLQADCTAKGGQFVLDKVDKSDNPIYSSASVSGRCVIPAPGSVPAAKPNTTT